MQVQPYLFFDGRCEEAIEFYRKTLGAEVEHDDAVQGQSRALPGGRDPARQREQGDACGLQIGDATVMASDGRCTGAAELPGIFALARRDRRRHAKRLFDALSDGGQVQMPLTKTFFASSFGMVADRFGVSWMVIKPAM